MQTKTVYFPGKEMYTLKNGRGNLKRYIVYYKMIYIYFIVTKIQYY